MQLKFTGDISDLLQGMKSLAPDLGITLGEEGFPLEVRQRPGNLEVGAEASGGYIRFAEKIHFFRGLGLWLEQYKEGKCFSIEEEPQFTMNGAMFDCSRNAVLKVESIKKLLRKMALMGLNMMMLYTEDTYAIGEEPYFGHMRGRYSPAELKACDDYAWELGIEVIPCIQTLAHLEKFLKWEEAAEYRDNGYILLVEQEKTYELIENMIKAASGAFRSKRIHLGMDEAEDLGLGRYLKLHGYQKRVEIMGYHLNKVLEITSRYGLKPMIWSDMFLKMASGAGEYYDKESVITQDIIDSVPKGMELVYWDYYHLDQESYTTFTRKHKEFNNNILFAGGIWTWTGHTVNYGKSFVTTQAALETCKREGIREVFATLWMDDGAENNFFSALLGLQLYAEHGYAKELDEAKLAHRVKFCTGIDEQAYRDISLLDETPGVAKDNPYNTNPSKYLLYQDVLEGLYDKHTEGLNLAEHYSRVEERMQQCSREFGNAENIFKVPSMLSTVLKMKSDIGLRLRELYRSKDLNGLRNMAENELPGLYRQVENLRKTHREVWFEIYKPFGWEVLDIRYGGTLSRIESASWRLMELVEGKVDRIEELEEERLYYYDPAKTGYDKQICNNNYKTIVTACAF